MQVLLSMLWLACASPETPSDRPALAPLTAATGVAAGFHLRGHGAPVQHLLDELDDASISLPESSLSPSGPTGGRIALAHGWTRAGRAVWVHDSPIHFDQLRFRAAPSGITLLKADQALPYAPGTEQHFQTKDGWEFASNHVYLSSTRSPASWDPPPTLHHPEIEQNEQRYNWTLSGLSPRQFATARIALDGTTQDALLLPAPGQARFQVDVEHGATLRFSWGIARPDHGVLGEKPAHALFQVSVDDEVVWSQPGTAGQGWSQATVDLSKWAGQRVAITLHTQPGDTPVGDYCAFGNPDIVQAQTDTGPRRIIVVGMDTLRHDHLGISGYERNTTPGMDAIGAQSVIFDQAWAPAPRTRPSFRTSTTGRWPLAAIGAATSGDVLSKAGFETAGIVANVHLAPRLGFAHGFHTWVFHHSGDAEDQVDRALDWLTRHEREDSFLFLHFMDPHVFYLAPEPYTDLFTGGLQQGRVDDRYNRWLIETWERRGRLNDQAKAFMKARYDGEIAYMDAQLRRLVSRVDAMPGQTLMVFHSDHGEEFWDHGRYEHNHTLYEELTHAVLWVRPPGGLADGPIHLQTPVSLADIAPSLYAAAAIPATDWPPMDGQSLLPLLTREDDGALADALRDRPLQLGHLMFDTERWGVVADGGKYILQTGSGEEELYDLTTDPHEQRDLSTRQADRLPRWRRALSQATGWPVGPGLRLELEHVDRPFELRFPSPVQAAGVIDPEAMRERRANLEWGEVPPVIAADVAAVVLSDDHLRISVTPGDAGSGTLYVLGPETLQGATLSSAGQDHPLQTHAIHLGHGSILAHPGTIIVPRETEASHLASVDDPDAIDALRALGYVE